MIVNLPQDGPPEVVLADGGTIALRVPGAELRLTPAVALTVTRGLVRAMEEAAGVVPPPAFDEDGLAGLPEMLTWP